MEILDDCGSTIDYIVKRLNWDEQTKENALKSYPSIAKCHVTKVSMSYFDEFLQTTFHSVKLIIQAKNLLDFLLSETHFTEDDISSYPRVFSNSLETLKTRLKELKSVKLHPKRLYVICLESKRYLKMIEQHCNRFNDTEIWSNFHHIETRIKQKCK